MKKRIIFAIIMFMYFFSIPTVDAAKVTGNISVSTTNTVVGNSGKATLTLSSDTAFGQIYGTFTCGGLGSKDLSYVANDPNSPQTSISYTINWKAGTTGAYTCQVTGLEIGTLDLDWPSVSVSPKTITVVKATSSGSSGNNSTSSGNSGSSSSNKGNGGTTATKKEYSSDNNLSILEVEGYKITPEFNKDVTEYKLTVDEKQEKINIKAKASHEKASVSGTGEKNISSGENTIEVRVTAENGNEKIYKIIIKVEDQYPIKVKIDKDEYTIVKKNNNLIEKLEYYEEEIIKIDNQDVIAYTNKTTKITLVLLKDKNNKINYYIYNKENNTYSEYKYIKIQNITLQLLDSPYKLDHYKKYPLNLQDKKIDIYKLNKKDKVGLIYGTNLKTGNTSYYVYDELEETLSKYYEEEIKVLEEEIKTLKNYLMIFMGVVSFFVILIIIISLVQNKKKKRRKYTY